MTCRETDLTPSFHPFPPATMPADPRISHSRRLVLPEERARRRRQASFQLRVNGQFRHDNSNPGRSRDTERRKEASYLEGTPADRDQNCREALDIAFVTGERSDFIPALVNEGPLLQFLYIVIAKSHRPRKRKIFALAKNHYLHLRRLRDLPRRALKHTGVVVRKNTAVYSRVRLPNPESVTDMVRVKRLLQRFIRSGACAFPSVEEAMESLHPVLTDYDIVRKEYRSYSLAPDQIPPQMSNSTGLSASIVPLVQGINTNEHQGRSCLQENNVGSPAIDYLDSNDMIYVERIDATARNDREYVLLKRVLCRTQEDLMPCLGHLFSKHIRTTGYSGPLTSMEDAIVRFCSETDSAKKSDMRWHLERFLICCIQFRFGYQMDLYEGVGYHPSAALENISSIIVPNNRDGDMED